MSALGRPVLVSRYSRNYQLSGYLRRYTTQPLRFATSASTLVSLMQAANYGELEGGLLGPSGDSSRRTSGCTFIRCPPKR